MSKDEIRTWLAHNGGGGRWAWRDSAISGLGDNVISMSLISDAFDRPDDSSALVSFTGEIR